MYFLYARFRAADEAGKKKKNNPPYPARERGRKWGSPLFLLTFSKWVNVYVDQQNKAHNLCAYLRV